MDLQEQNRQDLAWLREQQAANAAERFASPSSAAAAPQNNSVLPPRSNGQPYFTPGGFSEAKDGVIAGIFAPILAACYMAAARELVRRGQPQGNRTYAKAMGHALSVVWQWKAWSFNILYWVVSGACIYFWMGAEQMQGFNTAFHMRLLVLHAAMLVVAIGVPYCQAIDASFFKKRALYQLLSPIHKVLGWVPWFVLQSTVLLPFLFIIQYRW